MAAADTERIERLERENQRLRRDNEQLRREVEQLRRRIQELERLLEESLRQLSWGESDRGDLGEQVERHGRLDSRQRELL